MESEGETSVRPLQSQLILYEVISSAETKLTHTHADSTLPPPSSAEEQISPEVCYFVPAQKKKNPRQKKKSFTGSRFVKENPG